MSCTRKRSLNQMYSGASPDESVSRSGKWSAEEELYANKLIVQFETGTLTDCAEGSTLRSYLARKLNCAPMRISKKFAGQCIGKHTFTKKDVSRTPATDCDSLSEATTLTSSPAVNDDPLDFMWENAIDIMSGDSFTHAQGRHDIYASSKTGVSCPLSGREGVSMTSWSNSEIIPQYGGCQLVSATEIPCRTDDVGLDLDNMYASCGVANVTPFEYARMTPPPGPACSLPVKQNLDLKCTIPQYEYRARSPSTVIPSGAAVVTPSHAGPVAPSTFVPVPAQQYRWCQHCQQYDTCVSGAIEAAEWRDVLDYFCGPQELYC